MCTEAATPQTPVAQDTKLHMKVVASKENGKTALEKLRSQMSDADMAFVHAFMVSAIARLPCQEAIDRNKTRVRNKTVGRPGKVGRPRRQPALA